MDETTQKMVEQEAARFNAAIAANADVLQKSTVTEQRMPVVMVDLTDESEEYSGELVVADDSTYCCDTCAREKGVGFEDEGSGIFMCLDCLNDLIEKNMAVLKPGSN